MSEISDSTQHIIKLWRRVEDLDGRIDNIENTFIMIQKPRTKNDYIRMITALVAIGVGLSTGVGVL